MMFQLILAVMTLPVVHAFHWQPLQTHTFTFGSVPYEQGVRHIHCPEHIQNAHGLTMPGFRITQTHPPQPAGAGAIVAFSYKTVFGRGQARMFTDDRSKSNVCLFDRDDNPFFMANLEVFPEGLHGHRVVVRGQFFRPPTWLQAMLAPSYLNMHLLEDQFFWAYSVAREDPNLRQYRRRVLYGLRAPLDAAQ